MVFLTRRLALMRLNHYYRQSLRLASEEQRLSVIVSQINQAYPIPQFAMGLQGIIWHCQYYLEVTIFNRKCDLIHVWIWWLRKRLDRNTKQAKGLTHRHRELFK